jgi:hypothetical protein
MVFHLIKDRPLHPYSGTQIILGLIFVATALSLTRRSRLG